MSWKRSLLAVVGSLALVAPSSAQIAGRPLEVSAGAGILGFDARDYIQDNVAATGSLGWRWSPLVTIESSFLYSQTERDLPGAPSFKFLQAGGDLRWTLREPSGRVVPYLLTGFGYGRGQDESGVVVEKGSPSLGIGALFNLFGNPRWYVRAQVRDAMLRTSAAPEFSNHMAATIGLQTSFGGKSRDQDLDGVRDWVDACPNTPIGAKVDAKGCPLDSDKDGVFDGIDKCEGTAAGCKVDPKTGCIVDADGDGVCDGLDTCADTPTGVKVDAKGCPLDTDGDGVFDGPDQCEGTPKGAEVDDKGCPKDSDGDGSPDGLDQCPNTPAGLKVDPNGCPIEVSERETQLLDTGVIRIQNINFDVNKATIKPESFPVLDEVAAILLQYPQLELEVGGHTDASGKKDANMKLSEARAKSVLGYLSQKYPTIDVTKFTVKGYGPTLPVASNSTALGKAKNRRVEFKVTNTEQLRIERERRRFLNKDESTPK